MLYDDLLCFPTPCFNVLIAPNDLRLGVVRVFGEEFVGKTNVNLETRTPFCLYARISPSRC